MSIDFLHQNLKKTPSASKNSFHGDFLIFQYIISDFLLVFFQEEGWLMGFKEATGQKGMFPANFTRPMWSGQFFLVLVTKTRSDLRKEEKQNTHDAATKFKFLYKINQRNNQSKNLTYGWPWLMKKNQEETKTFSKLV